MPDDIQFWAKTQPDGTPGISVVDHCVNVGCVADVLISGLVERVAALLPSGAVTLAATHDVGKITIGFQAKCPMWLQQHALPRISPGAVALSITDHALVSQVVLQELLGPPPLRLWAVAVGAHHGRPKGRNAQLPSSAPEALADWAGPKRREAIQELCSVFGPLPTAGPDLRLPGLHSDLWLLAGLISVADWIGSNETWFPSHRGLPVDEARSRAREALQEIGWPGGKLRRTSFSKAFALGPESGFQPNAVQQAVAEVAVTPGIIIVEAQMGCGKTEAALFAAQQLIASDQQHGIYFALPTQVTSNRIHERIEVFLRNTLREDARLRLVHGNAWLEDDYDLKLSPAFTRRDPKDADDPAESVREARSWFASSKQALLAPYGVGTIDQALQGVVAVKHFFVRRFALAGKVVILDEVHSYDVYTGTLVAALIRELVHLRCTVIVLSATLTAVRRRELLAAAGVTERTAPVAYPLISSASPGGECQHFSPPWTAHRRVMLRPAVSPEEETIAELITRAEAGQHVLWIRNTVVEAQATLRLACASIREGLVRVGLLHSRFPLQRRSELESDWLTHLGRSRPAEGPGSILIATQVVEQSVDLDLDFIVSDLAPTDMLLQRLGRLWRHERPVRKAGFPEFWVRLPELPEGVGAPLLKKALGRSARVYAPYVLVRTWEVWRSKSSIDLPGDIRPLLEATYAEADATEPEAWTELHQELEAEKAILSGNAEAATRVLRDPMLDDRDEVLTRRRGAPTTPVVLLRSYTAGRNGLVTLVALDGSQCEASEYEWRRSAARLLHLWTVRAPRWLVPAEAPTPRWLATNGAFGATAARVGEDGSCTVGETVSAMSYTPRLGLFAGRQPQSVPQPRKDDHDDDEFDY